MKPYFRSKVQFQRSKVPAQHRKFRLSQHSLNCSCVCFSEPRLRLVALKFSFQECYVVNQAIPPKIVELMRQLVALGIIGTVSCGLSPLHGLSIFPALIVVSFSAFWIAIIVPRYELIFGCVFVFLFSVLNTWQNERLEFSWKAQLLDLMTNLLFSSVVVLFSVTPVYLWHHWKEAKRKRTW
jgi:hypothetical protein